MWWWPGDRKTHTNCKYDIIEKTRDVSSNKNHKCEVLIKSFEIVTRRILDRDRPQIHEFT